MATALGSVVQGCLAHKKSTSLRTLPWAYAQGPTRVLGGWAFSYERGTPVTNLRPVVTTLGLVEMLFRCVVATFRGVLMQIDCVEMTFQRASLFPLFLSLALSLSLSLYLSPSCTG